MKALNLIPIPKRVSRSDGTYIAKRDGIINLPDNSLYPYISAAKAYRFADAKLTVGGSSVPPTVNILREDGYGGEGYRLTVADDGIKIYYSEIHGAFYGFMTLTQLCDLGYELPYIDITDEPFYPLRGYMLDIGRNKVPKLCEIKRLVDRLARLKVNHLELYIEGVPFEYKSFPLLWQGREIMTGEEIMELDRYCIDRCVELVPTQNNFGHMDKWLYREFRDYAECPDGFHFDGCFLPDPRCLNPLDPRCEELINKLADDFLPYFTSDKYNICCDETLELGQGRSKDECERLGKGRVYLDFLKKVVAAAERRGKQVYFWDDVIKDFPELLPEIPEGVTALEWGYMANQPSEEGCIKLEKSGVKYLVCPGTGAWNTFLGKTSQMISNINNAACFGKAHGASGLLNTDWGDSGHLQSIATSYSGIAYGAAMAWGPDENKDMALAPALDAHVFFDRAGVMGKFVLDAGNYYEYEGTIPYNITLSFRALLCGLGGHPLATGLTYADYDRVENYLKALYDLPEKSDMDCPDAQQILVDYRLALDCVILLQTLMRYYTAFIDADAEKQKVFLHKLCDDIPGIIGRTREAWLARSKYSYLDESLVPWENIQNGARARLKALNEA